MPTIIDWCYKTFNKKSPSSSTSQPTIPRSKEPARQKTITAAPKEATFTPSQKTTQSTWKKNQAVTHSKFGTGIVKSVEEKADGSYYITAQFKSGEKKLLAKFLQRI